MKKFNIQITDSYERLQRFFDEVVQATMPDDVIDPVVADSMVTSEQCYRMMEQREDLGLRIEGFREKRESFEAQEDVVPYGRG